MTSFMEDDFWDPLSYPMLANPLRPKPPKEILNENSKGNQGANSNIKKSTRQQEAEQQDTEVKEPPSLVRK
jgi:hypothetical protein